MSARSLGRTGGPVVVLGVLVGLAVAVNPVLVPILLVGGLAAAAAVARPELLVGGMFLGMLFDRAGLTGMKLDQFPVTASKLSVLGSLVLWAVHAGVSRATPVRWHPVLTALAGMVVATAICVASANSMKEGKFSLFGLGMMMVLVGLVYAVLAEARLGLLYRFIAACLCGAIVLSGIRASGAGEAARAAGTMGDPNEWATMVIVLTGLVLGGLAWDETPLAKPLRIGVVLLAPLSIVASESRTALLVAGLVFPGCVWLLRHRRSELLTALGIAALAAPFVIDFDRAFGRFAAVVDRLRGVPGPPDPSLEERGELFRQGVDLFQHNWFMGVGPGNFARATGFVSQTGTLRPAHDTYLEIASEQGLFGLIPTAIFGVTVAWTFWRGARNARTPNDHARIVGIALGLAGVAAMAATLGLLTFAMAWLVLGFGLAAIHHAERRVG